MDIKEWATIKWLSIPAAWREHMISAGHTFVTATVLQLAIDVEAQNYVISWEKGALISLAAAAIRAGVKATLAAAISWYRKRKQA